MKTRIFKYFRAFVCLALALVICVAALGFSSCAQTVADPVMQHGDNAISLELYNFLLSRMKGTLARQGHDVSAISEFWGEMHGDSGLTNEQYYNKAVVETCKKYLAALAIFDEQGMTLSETTLAAIEEEISFYIAYDGDGDEAKFDAILAKYGTNTAGLRQMYEIEAKYNAVITSLYGAGGSQISGNVKDEYYKENYYRFKQILIANYYYEYVTDENGDLIYFNPEDGKPIYDENGEYHYDENDNRVLDDYGVAIKYDEDGNILYDKEKGKPTPTKDDKGYVIEHFYTNDEMAERVAKIEGIIASANGGNYSAFEKEMPNWVVYIGAGEYCPEGYYLSDIESSSYDENMLKILAELKDMTEGEVRAVEGENGYHVIMKYKLDAGKYENSEYSEWFLNFNDSLVNKLFKERCAKYYDGITVNEDVLDRATSIKSIGINFDY